MKKFSPLTTTVALLCLYPAAAWAQSAQVLASQSWYNPSQQPVATPTPEHVIDAAPPDWNIRLGAGVQFQPKYEGSDQYKAAPLPMLMIGYRDLVFLHGPMLGGNAITWKGAGPNDKLQVGPLVRYQQGRDQDDSSALSGMGDIDAAVELGGFINYTTGPWSAGLTVFHDVSGSHDGTTAKLSAGNRLPLAPKWRLRSEVAITWADDAYTDTFFGVTSQQSSRSGLREYKAEGGFKDVGLSLDVDYSLTEQWGLTTRVGYKRLVGDAADSPLVSDRGSANQLTGGLFSTYKF